jgi:hypothetical protein
MHRREAIRSRNGQTRELVDIKDVGREDNSGARGFGCWLWISRAACGSVLHVPNGG